MTMEITIEQVLTWNPCSTYRYPEYLRKLFGGDSITPREMSQLDIPANHIVWGLLHCVEDGKTQRGLACEFAERVLPIYEKQFEDKRPREAIERLREYLRYEASIGQLEAAATAAAEAAAEADKDEIYSAYSAAMAAAEAAGETVYCAATRASAAVAYEVAEDFSEEAAVAERRWQIDRILEVLEERQPARRATAPAYVETAK
jgi:hypothetical protein